MCSSDLALVLGEVTSAGNEQVDIIATIYLAADDVKAKLGIDPGPGIVVLETRVVPKTDKPMSISPDDFILLAHDDGERSQPFDAAQLAGDGALVVSSTPVAGAGKRGSSIGFGGAVMGGGGSSPGNPKETAMSSKMDTKKQGNEALVAALRAKQMPAKNSIEPVEGYLYFPLQGKHKLKDLAVLYRGPAGKLNLEFQH